VLQLLPLQGLALLTPLPVTTGESHRTFDEFRAGWSEQGGLRAADALLSCESALNKGDLHASSPVADADHPVLRLHSAWHAFSEAWTTHNPSFSKRGASDG
jgi:hypothetical protein